MASFQRLAGLIFLGFILLAGPAAAQTIDPELLAKAIDYDREAQSRHVPGYGGLVQIAYETDELLSPILYRGQGDSTMWTATYGVTQAFRYAVTGEAEAKANAVAAVQTLRDHLRVTQTTGYLGRYVGPLDDNRFWLDVFQLDEFRYGEGVWLGTFWLSNSSSDQHVGFFHAMAIIHDLIDDPPTRQLIKSMVREVIDRLRGNFWLIIDEQGLPTTAAPQINGGEKLSFALIAAHLLDTPEYWALYDEVFAQEQALFPFNSTGFWNRYTEYFAMNLKHQNFFSLFSLEPDLERLEFYFDVYLDKVRPWVADTHQVYFDWVYLVGCRRLNRCEDSYRLMEEGVASLRKFPVWPNREIHVEPGPPPGGVDPISEWLVDFAAQLPDWLIELTGLEFERQAAGGYDLDHRCRVEYLWQRSPHQMTCGGFLPNYIHPGADYLMAYWMGRSFDFLNPHDLDPPIADDDDNDLDDDDNDDNDDNDDQLTSDDDDAASPDASDDDDNNACGC